MERKFGFNYMKIKKNKLKFLLNFNKIKKLKF